MSRPLVLRQCALLSALGLVITTAIYAQRPSSESSEPPGGPGG